MATVPAEALTARLSLDRTCIAIDVESEHGTVRVLLNQRDATVLHDALCLMLSEMSPHDDSLFKDGGN